MNARTTHGLSPLMLAAKVYAPSAITKKLLQHDSALACICPHSCKTAFSIALESGYLDCAKQIWDAAEQSSPSQAQKLLSNGSVWPGPACLAAAALQLEGLRHVSALGLDLHQPYLWGDIPLTPLWAACEVWASPFQPCKHRTSLDYSMHTHMQAETGHLCEHASRNATSPECTVLQAVCMSPIGPGPALKAVLFPWIIPYLTTSQRVPALVASLRP